MGTKAQHTRPLDPNIDNNDLVTWINQQIKAGNFTAISSWLENFDSKSTGKDILPDICQSAIKLCQICQNHQEEMDASWAAYQRAVNQEKALSANLANILNLLVEQTGNNQLIIPEMSHASAESQFAPPSQSSTVQTGIWQRVQNFFNRPQIQSDILDPESISPEKEIPLKTDTPAVKMPVPAAAVPRSQVAEKRIPDIQKYASETIVLSKARQPAIVPQEPNIVMSQTNTEILKKREGIPSLAIYTLGSFRVYQDDIPVLEWSNKKGASLFKFLLAQRKEKLAKEVLMDMFWPDAEPDAARNNLNVTIYNLRKILRNGYHNFSHILFKNGYYLLNPEMIIWVDSESFEQNVLTAQEHERNGRFDQAIHNYHAAEALYQGEYLSEDRYEDWPIVQRQNLQNQYVSTLEKLSSHYFENGELTLSIRLCRQILATDAFQEEAHRRLMLSYAQLGQPHLALRQFYQLSECLQEELNVKPSPETIHLLNLIRNHNSV